MTTLRFEKGGQPALVGASQSYGCAG